MHCGPRSCAPTPSSCGSSSSAASPPPLTPRSLCDSSGRTSESLRPTDPISATAMGEVTCEVLDEIGRQSARSRRDRESPPFHATSRKPEHGIADTYGRDNDEAEPPSDHPKRQLSRFRRGSAAYREDWRERHGDQDYEQVSTDEDENDDDEPRPRPRKRRKPAPPARTAPSSASSPRVRSRFALALPPPLRGTASARRSSRLCTMPTPSHSSSSQTGDDLDEAACATFEEWPLHDVCLKRVTEQGTTTFQLQFTWDPHGHKKRASEDRAEAKRHGRIGRCRNTNRRFTADEDERLIELKENHGLSWGVIHRRFVEDFPWRSRTALQVHYSTKLGNRGSRAGGSGQRRRRNERGVGLYHRPEVAGWTAGRMN
ncbi:hypothetical protein ACJZ2D_010821 [Fusarium nematophilum]